MNSSPCFVAAYWDETLRCDFCEVWYGHDEDTVHISVADLSLADRSEPVTYAIRLHATGDIEIDLLDRPRFRVRQVGLESMDGTYGFTYLTGDDTVPDGEHVSLRFVPWIVPLLSAARLSPGDAVAVPFAVRPLATGRQAFVEIRSVVGADAGVHEVLATHTVRVVLVPEVRYVLDSTTVTAGSLLTTAVRAVDADGALVDTTFTTARVDIFYDGYKSDYLVPIDRGVGTLSATLRVAGNWTASVAGGPLAFLVVTPAPRAAFVPRAAQGGAHVVAGVAVRILAEPVDEFGNGLDGDGEADVDFQAIFPNGTTRNWLDRSAALGVEFICAEEGEVEVWVTFQGATRVAKIAFAPVTYEYAYSDWSSCDAVCTTGAQTRTPLCVSTRGETVRPPAL